MADFIVVLITASSFEEGEVIAKKLVEEKLVACCNIVKDLTSNYIWDNRLCKDNEILLIFKTRLERFEELKKRVKELHSYSLPEIVALPIIAGSEEYLNWIEKMTTL